MGIPDFLAIFDHHLQQQGLYVTCSRKKIAEVVSQLSEPFDVQALWVTLRPERIGLATVYRTLELLEQAGLIRLIPSEVTEYEVVYMRPRHELMRCQACGKWIKFFSERLEEDLEDVATLFGFSVRRRLIVLEGICKACGNDGTSSSKTDDPLEG